MLKRPTLWILLLLATLGWRQQADASSAPATGEFARPDAKYQPWVFWNWINGNITRVGITKDLEGGKTYFGSPAEEARSKFRELALIRKLPKAIETLGL